MILRQPQRARRALGPFILMLVALAWLQPAPAQEGRALLAFTEHPPLMVDATALDVRNVDASPTTYPYVTARAPVPYDQAIKAWANQRFKLTGGSVNTLRVTMRQGAIVEKLLPVTKGIKGWFTKDQNAEYTATLAVDVAIVDPSGQVLTTVDSKSFATETIREDATSADRDNTWLGLVRKTVDNMDGDLVPRMREVMASYVH
jgi:hypothetical protein